MIIYARSYSNCENSVIIKRFLLGRRLSLYSTKKFWAESSCMWAESSWIRVFCSFRAGPNLLWSESSSTRLDIVHYLARNDVNAAE